MPIQSKDLTSRAHHSSLDGWRGISILLVLSGHLLPVGPKQWQMNAAFAASGMAIFFTLSGFLITKILLEEKDLINFLIRRFFRILPLAWSVLFLTLTLTASEPNRYLPNFLFYANLPPYYLIEAAGHFWSLCVEVQFYLSVTVLVLVFRTRIVFILPILCIVTTLNKAMHGVQISIDTYYRIDEILAGCTLAIIFTKLPKITSLIGRSSFFWLFPLLLISAHPEGHIFSYFRPYFALLLVGSTLKSVSKNENWLHHPYLIYIAKISYALYVVHGVLNATWLGEGNGLIKYVKRLPLLLATFSIAHLSTFYFEKYWITLGHQICRKRNARREVGNSLTAPNR